MEEAPSRAIERKIVTALFCDVDGGLDVLRQAREIGGSMRARRTIEHIDAAIAAATSAAS